MKRIALPLLAIALCGVSALGQTTQKFTATKANDYVLAYTLPNTVLDLVIETELTERAPGEFYKYAKKYLKANDPIAAPSRSITVKSVTIVPRGVANPEERYGVKFSAGNPPFMILNDQGLPLAINTETVYEGPVVTLPVAQAAAPTPLETDAARQAQSQDMLNATSTAKRAELAAEQIFALRESRNEIISGQSEKAFPDGKSLQLALDNLNAQEAALTAMFMGTEKVSTQVSTITYEPFDDVDDQVVARVSANAGSAVDPDDLTGDPVYLSLQIIEEGRMPVDDKGNTVAFPKNGFAYTIPGKAIVTISYDGRQMARQQVELAQAGVTYGLAPNLFTDKKAPMYLIMDPTTGATRELGPATR
ncbi:MAG: DUF4831 family protein [Bacteroidales bacterium]|nr:DUF4831 family protein [Bacteroidales bacterium]